MTAPPITAEKFAMIMQRLIAVSKSFTNQMKVRAKLGIPANAVPAANPLQGK
jgi:hypothetical protein